MSGKHVVLMIRDKGWRKAVLSELSEIRIGGAGDSDVVISNDCVCDRHCVINCRGGTYSIRDLGSKQSTFLDDSRLEPNREYPLYHAANISLGAEDGIQIVFLITEQFGGTLGTKSRVTT